MHRVAIGLLILSALGAAQESWDQPVRITGTVVDGSDSPIAGAEVALRTFVQPLVTTGQRRAAFDSLGASTRADQYGRWTLTLPEWTLAFEAPLAVVAMKTGCVGQTEFVYPFRRETHHDIRLYLGANDEPGWARLVDEDGTSIAGARVAGLVGTNASLKIHPGAGGIGWGDNLVVGLSARTDDEGWVNVSGAAAILLVERATEVVAVVPRPRAGTYDVVVPRVWAADDGLRSALDRHGDPLPAQDEIAKVLREKFAGSSVVEGRVLDPDGKPLAGAQVAVISHDAEPDPFASIRMPWARLAAPFARTDASGRFRVARLPAATYRLQVAVPEIAPKTTSSFRLNAGEKYAAGVVQLEHGARLLVVGSWGYVRFGETAYVAIEGAGEIKGLPQGEVFVRTWNGACCVSQAARVKIPKGGIVSVDLTERGLGFLRAY